MNGILNNKKRPQKEAFPTMSLCWMFQPRHHPVTVRDTGFCNINIAYFNMFCQSELSPDLDFIEFY